MKYGCGLKKDRFLSWMSFMLGFDSIPYCWAAKSIRKEAGAYQTCQQRIEEELSETEAGPDRLLHTIHLAVEYEIPMAIVDLM